MDILLRKLEESDVEMMREWLQKPYIMKWFYHPRGWIKEIELRSTEFSFITHYIFLVDNVPVGFCQFYDYSKGGEDFEGTYKVNKTASIDYMIGVEEYLGKHLSIEMIHLLENEIISRSELTNIIVQPDKDNLISRKTLLSAGYFYDSKNDIFVKILKA